MRAAGRSICAIAGVLQRANAADLTGLGAGEPCAQELELPKSVESGNLGLNKAVIRWMSAETMTTGLGEETKIMFGDFRAAISRILVRQDSKPATEPMLAFFLSTLDVRTTAIEPRIAGDAEKMAILTRVKDKLKTFSDTTSGDKLWNEAYCLERLVALIEPSDGLFLELNRRTNEAIEAAIPTSARLKNALDSAVTDLFDGSKPPKLKENAEVSARMLLLNALEELHWTYKRRFYARPLIKKATSITVFAGLIALIIFIIPYCVLYAYYYENNELRNLPWAWLPLYTALSAGLFGTFFSRLLFLQFNVSTLSLEAIRDARDPMTIIFRAIVGTCGALIVYFFLQSGLINGSVFPDFKELGIVKYTSKDGIQLTVILPSAQLSLLVVWSFLAGFSERLVPNILASTEKTLSDATQKGKP